MPQTSPLLILTHSPGFQVFSSPSAVTSDTHTPVLKGFRKRRFAVFWFTQAGRSPANAAFKNAPRRELSRQKTTAPQPAKTYNKRRTFPPKDPPSPIHQKLITREDQLAGPNRTANPLPEIQSELPLGFNFCFAAEAPLSPPFRNPAFACGDLPIGCAQKTTPLMRLSRRTGIWRR